MEIILYILIFLIGTVFGSFYTLAVHRIPKRENITHKHSYCPNCKNKLGFLDLIPVFSYIFLGAKCRHCKQKIRPRYFILEILSGLLFVLIAYLLDISIYTINNQIGIECMFLALYLTFVFITAGIDKELRKIEKPVIYYGILISIIYIVYLCLVEKTSIYRYIIYLIMYVIILILDTIELKKFAKNKYIINILLLLIILAIFTSDQIIILTIFVTIISIGIYIPIEKLILKIQNKKETKKYNKELLKENENKIYTKIPIGYFLVISNVIVMIFSLII